MTELADENFLAPMQSWATAHHTLLRSQTYGFPPVSLSSNRIADLPEGEGITIYQENAPDGPGKTAQTR